MKNTKEENVNKKDVKKEKQTNGIKGVMSILIFMGLPLALFFYLYYDSNMVSKEYVIDAPGGTDYFDFIDGSLDDLPVGHTYRVPQEVIDALKVEIYEEIKKEPYVASDGFAKGQVRRLSSNARGLDVSEKFDAELKIKDLYYFSGYTSGRVKRREPEPGPYQEFQSIVGLLLGLEDLYYSHPNADWRAFNEQLGAPDGLFLSYGGVKEAWQGNSITYASGVIPENTGVRKFLSSQSVINNMRITDNSNTLLEAIAKGIYNPSFLYNASKSQEAANIHPNYRDKMLWDGDYNVFYGKYLMTSLVDAEFVAFPKQYTEPEGDAYWKWVPFYPVAVTKAEGGYYLVDIEMEARADQMNPFMHEISKGHYMREDGQLQMVIRLSPKGLSDVAGWGMGFYSPNDINDSYISNNESYGWLPNQQAIDIIKQYSQALLDELKGEALVSSVRVAKMVAEQNDVPWKDVISLYVSYLMFR